MISLHRQSPAIGCFAVFCWLFFAENAYTQFATIINVPPKIGNNQSISSDTQLNVFDGGDVGNGFIAGDVDGSSVNIEVNVLGGLIGSRFAANGASTVNISGGIVGSRFDANSGSTVNISGGYFGNSLNANSGSTVNIWGGTGLGINANSGSIVNISSGAVDVDYEANDGSTVTISGGTVDQYSKALNGSTVNISGGSIGSGFIALSGSHVNISGGEFRLDGSLIDGLGTVGSVRATDIPDNSLTRRSRNQEGW